MYEIPVAVVLGEIAEAFVGVEEQVFVPLVSVFTRVDPADLVPDHFVLCTVDFPARTQRNGWLDLRLALKLLQNLDFRRRSIQNAQALRTNHTQRMCEAA